MKEISKYVGVPFVSLGRDMYGADCWGLVRLIYADLYKIELPTLLVYEDALQHEDVAKKITALKPLITSKELEEPEEGCIVLLASQGLSGHVGVFIGDGMIIHTTKQTGAVIESLSRIKAKNKVKGYYRVNTNYYTK